MAEVFLITGGARSGKSAYAETLASALPGTKAYIATCPVLDDEMAERIARHRENRRHDGWFTIEEQINLSSVIEQNTRYNTILVDCLTLWLNNLMYHAGEQHRELTEPYIVALCAELQKACGAHPGRIIFVINEVGLGIVPDNAVARRFRDLSGRCSQVVAAFADHVTFVSCGIPLQLK